MADLETALPQLIKGAQGSSPAELEHFSHDASLFEIRPRLVVRPQDAGDVCKLVEYVSAHKAQDSTLSITARSGGTDMSGGAINDSIILSLDNFNHIGSINGQSISVEPGVYYRDFEKQTLTHNLLMPAYPASRDICKIGGMIANNAGGEKSLVYGKTDRYVSQLQVVLADGKQYSIKPLNPAELKAKMAQADFEGTIYRKLFELVNTNHQFINSTRPRVSKNSTGYNLWDVWDGQNFDLTKLIVGSQGTLGIVTSATFKLVKAKPLSGMVVAFLPSLDGLGGIITTLLELKPTSLESFDEHTLKLAFRFFLGFRKTLGWRRFALLALSFIPVVGKLIKHILHLPKIIMLVEFEGESQSEIAAKIEATKQRLTRLNIDSQVASNRHQEEKFWIMRRESFNLLRKNIKRLHTAPFIDDLVVPPQFLSEFLPRLTKILDENELFYTVAGHMGDGNFHIIPLMDLTQPSERAKIEAVLRQVTDLVLEYHGSLSGEHNDGLIRGPFLQQMYSVEMMALFREVKAIFDPQNIFNPHKKTDATWEYSSRHIRQGFN